MNVSLLNYTQDALELLLFTKNTRLRMSAVGLDDIKAWPEEKKAEELRYMRNTIQSSWEFCDYTFILSDVTRAFTHQLVRHRVGVSFAQQAQRVVDMTGFGYETGDSIKADWDLQARYDRAMLDINDAYAELLSDGAAPQDARGVLPTNIHTNIVFKANLRTLHEMALKRLCVKAQGEFQNVFRAIVAEVVRVHPWAADFLQVQCGWNATCLFPSLPMSQCPVKPGVFDPETGRAYNGEVPMSLVQIRRIHAEERAEVQPVIPQ